MWEFVTFEKYGREYVCDFLREYSTDISYIDGVWIANLMIKRDCQLVYSYNLGLLLDEMDETDRTVYEEIISDYN
ncbi:hypothetical protein [Streptococcus suis]|uniref:hypothetical protein n=1 Tax=Streptococcus suis TaxID=1307 RepID=UPI00128FEBF4|nr:hypothetical protein [Streptococcus suis]